MRGGTDKGKGSASQPEENSWERNTNVMKEKETGAEGAKNTKNGKLWPKVSTRPGTGRKLLKLGKPGISLTERNGGRKIKGA